MFNLQSLTFGRSLVECILKLCELKDASSTVTLSALLPSSVAVTSYPELINSVQCALKTLGFKSEYKPLSLEALLAEAHFSSSALLSCSSSSYSSTCILFLANEEAVIFLGSDKFGVQLYFPKTKKIETVTILGLASDYQSYVLTIEKDQFVVAENVALIDDLKIGLNSGVSSYLDSSSGLAVSSVHSALPPKAALRRKGWFWNVFKQFWPVYAEVIAASFFINLFAILASLYTMNVYDRVVPHQAMDTLLVLTIGVMVIFIFDFVLKMLRGFFIDVVAKKTDIKLSSFIFHAMLDVQMKFRSSSVGSFANTVQQFDAFREFITSATLVTLIDIPFSVFMVVIVFLIGGVVGWVPLLAIPLIVVSSFVIQKYLSAWVRQSYQFSGRKHALVVESLQNVETLKTQNGLGFMESRFGGALSAYAELNSKVKSLALFATNLTGFIQQVATTLVVVVGVNQITQGFMTTGGIIACSILCGRILAPMGQLANLITRYQQSLSSLKSLDKMMALPQDTDIIPQYEKPLDGNLKFDNVIFNYEASSSIVSSSTSTSAIASLFLNLNISRGEKIGIIGKIGSGKSTLLKLVLGLYEPASGKVWFDGVNSLKFGRSYIREHVSYVPQEIQLLQASLKENILLGKIAYSENDLLYALNFSGLGASMMSELGNMVHENGTNLSGGQRQQVAIARAMLKPSHLILMDEPTSAMDSSAEHHLKSQLHSLGDDKTLLLVTHKLSMLDVVDRVIVLEEGKVILDGPKDKVLAFLEQREEGALL